MSRTQLFSSGLELANFVGTLDILHDAWSAIWNLYTEINNEGPSPFVRFKVYEQPNCTIIAFFTWPANSKDSVERDGGGDFVSSLTLKESFPNFDFLCTKVNPSFCINEPAFQLFWSVSSALPLLRYKIDNSKPLIITGNSLGGSVATLFTLSLLEKFNFLTKRPLCITFGSPLIGDENLQEAISEYATWNSCFLHVVSDQDLVPRVLINGYQPFGTFLFCSKLGFSCFENQQTILKLLTATNSGTPENQDPNKVFESYGTLVEDLNRKVICKDTTDHESFIVGTTTPLRAGIITQLAAIGLVQSQEQQNVDINIIIAETEKRAKMMAIINQQAFNPTRGLNDMKVYMAYLERSKILSKEDKVGFYDRYKDFLCRGLSNGTLELHRFKRFLTCYWEEMVDQAEKRPQKVGAFLRTSSLIGGTSYRRMIEPLDIADYYNRGKQAYINQGRSKHYIKLEQWLKETKKPSRGPNEMKKQNVSSLLTEDSCFWAHVEEACISCKLLSSGESSDWEKESSKCKLIEFENYVLDMMKNYAVSPEIFEPGSSFMKWWREYRDIMGTSYSSHFTDLLNNDENYKKYATGCLEMNDNKNSDKDATGFQVMNNNDKNSNEDAGCLTMNNNAVMDSEENSKKDATGCLLMNNDENSNKFSSGLELANFAVSSGVLYHSWAAIWDLHSEINQNEHPSLSVRYKVSQQSNCTIIAFSTWPACSKDYIQGEREKNLISSSTLKESFPPLNFLCPKTDQHFSINKAAFELFASIRDRLPSLKSEIDSRPVIITGNSLGGSVASLFTLWLLETINLSTTKIRPLCITFGSPLLGDDFLQEAISKYPTWNSCFLHVVSTQDPIPRVLILPHSPIGLASQTNVFKPFGTFLLCSELGCACFEDSQSILELLMATYSEGPENENPNQVLRFYGALVQHLNHKVICKDATQMVERDTKSFRAGIITQLEAIGLERSQKQQRNKDINNLITKTERQEQKWIILKRHVFDPSKKLNDIKINMALLEWYKKYFKDKGIGYYDSYKNLSYYSDLTVVRSKKMLTSYWEELVDEVDKKPQKEGAYFRTQWLFAGTIYRRMIEPLDIAEYYNKGLKRYINEGRPKHYERLEQWLNEAEKPAQSKMQNVASSLSEDSCFWAHVEEARISCKLLSSIESSIEEKKLSKQNLIEFENYVLCLMKNYAVSTEIFLRRSSFMLWWKEYGVIIKKKIMGTSYTSTLTDLMKDRSY